MIAKVNISAQLYLTVDIRLISPCCSQLGPVGDPIYGWALIILNCADVK